MNEWGGFVDPDQAFHRHFHSAPGGKDFRRWKNAKAADELLDAGRTTLDRARRKQIYDQVQRLLAEDPISIPLYSPDLLYAMQKSRQGLPAAPDRLLLRPAVRLARELRRPRSAGRSPADAGRPLPRRCERLVGDGGLTLCSWGEPARLRA